MTWPKRPTPSWTRSPPIWPRGSGRWSCPPVLVAIEEMTDGVR